jgi:proline iminopeptidase
MLPRLVLLLAVALSNGEGDLTTPDGVRLHYRVAGRGEKVILLLHGGPGSNMNAVYPDLEPLADEFRFVMYDQRGGGRSEPIGDKKRLTADDHVRDLEAVRAHFGLSRVILMGESWGSGLAALYASRHPEHVSRIVFLGPMPPTKELSKQRLDAVDAQTGFYKRMAELRQSMATAADPVQACREFFSAYLKPYFADPSAMSRRRGDSCNTAEAGVRNYIAINDATIASLGDWDFRPILSKLDMPALVIEGEESRPTIASAKAWAAALPHGRLVLLPKAGHFPQVENPDVFFTALREFLHER